jgi:hypothetical protein
MSLATFHRYTASVRGLHYAFVDEYGNPQIDVTKEGVSKAFIITAVMVPEADLSAVRAQIEQVRRQHFQTGEMKSSSVAGNSARRFRAIRDLCQVEFRFYAFVVDKSEIWPKGGLVYKEPFIKFLHKQVFRRLYRAFPDVRIFADERGRRAFMNGFRKYVYQNAVPELFQKATFDFVASDKEVLVQAADLISGTLARRFDPDKQDDGDNESLALLKARCALIEEWPLRRKRLADLLPSDRSEEATDSLIQDHCYTQAQLFFEERLDDTDEDVLAQVHTLRQLMDHFEQVSPDEYLPTALLIEKLSAVSPTDITQQYFRSSVIARLRDAGVVIASSNRGYKIPSTLADIHSFAAHADSVALPMLARLKVARDQLLLASGGRLDIIEGEAFSSLRGLIETLGSKL